MHCGPAILFCLVLGMVFVLMVTLILLTHIACLCARALAVLLDIIRAGVVFAAKVQAWRKAPLDTGTSGGAPKGNCLKGIERFDMVKS